MTCDNLAYKVESGLMGSRQHCMASYIVIRLGHWMLRIPMVQMAFVSGG